MKKVGLALGSGGVRGFAHLGVLSVLEDNNIKVDVIVGCSLVSLFGALFCCGLDSAMIMKLAKGLGRDPWLDFVIPKMGFISTRKIYEIMKLLTKEQNIEDLPTIFATVGTDLQSGKEFVFTEGEQAFYKEKGFENEPQRCPDCRRARKQQNNNRGFRR